MVKNNEKEVEAYINDLMELLKKHKEVVNIDVELFNERYDVNVILGFRQMDKTGIEKLFSLAE